MRLGRIPGLRQVPPLLQRTDDTAVLFDSWRGAYSDNPRAISERLALRQPGLQRLWAVHGRQGTPPDGLASFVPDSRGYLEALGRSRYVVANHNMPGYFHKRPGTTYVQTWHGTPLKRIGFDIERPIYKRTRRDWHRLRRDVGAWDVLISPNRFSTDVLRQAFRYDGRIIETGYPRNDVLSSPDAASVGEEIRRRLGVPGEARVILYAPTWRDDESFSLELDLEQLLGQLAQDWVVLLRAHARVADTVAVSDGSRFLDLSRYPDIRDLYLAADVLVTDYSSAMFDFAVTRKPMLFYTYDLAHYRDEVRGFYFDFEREVPGPLLMTTAEVIEALAQLDDVARDHAGAYERFVQRFCHLEDGRASDRVIDAVFTS